jgi:hypothetical protein
MPYRRGSTANFIPKSPELVAAELAGKEAMRAYFAASRGRMAAVARATAINPPNLCKMAQRENYPIGLEFALLIEAATDGALRAAVLCPSRADLLAKFVALEAGEALAA